MDFGQTIDPQELSRISFDLPSLSSPEEQAQLARLSKAASRSPQLAKIYIGIPIFNHAAWAGSFYPESASPADYLREYSKQLSTVELNSTFYAVPSAETFTKWKSSVGSEFKFCPKFPKSVSHSLDASHADFKNFIERISLLGENLGACFLQLPHYFTARDADRLLTLLSAAPRELKTVVELRNADFFSGQRLKPEWVDKIASRFVGAVTVDTPLERAVAHVSLTSTRTMIRFLGGNLHGTDWTRLRDWAKRVALWHTQGMKEIYFIVHEPDNGAAPVAAKRMVEWVNEELAALRSSYKIPNIEWHSLWDPKTLD